MTATRTLLPLAESGVNPTAVRIALGTHWDGEGLKPAAVALTAPSAEMCVIRGLFARASISLLRTSAETAPTKRCTLFTTLPRALRELTRDGRASGRTEMMTRCVRAPEVRLA